MGFMPWVWMFFRRPRRTFPEYQSPNTWSDYFTKTRDCEILLTELENTFSEEQRQKYYKYKDAVLRAERAKPWQGDYAKIPEMLQKDNDK